MKKILLISFFCGTLTSVSLAQDLPINPWANPTNNTVKITNSPSTMDANAFQSNKATLTDIYVPWAEDSELSANAPWGASAATVHYNTVFE